MAKENDIKEELLKQMDKETAELPDADRNSAGKILENYRGQLRRLKWIAAISWLITVLYLLGMHMLKDALLESNLQYFLTQDEFLLVSYSDVGLKVLVVIAALLTYLVYSKSKTLTMVQICSRLANIEEHLKRMSQDK